VRRKQQKNDFLFVATLGSGTFGKVALVRHSRDQKLYAMKKVKKEVMDKMNQKKNLITEKAILLNIQSPFLTHLYFSFQDSKQLYFIIDYCGGGEMFYWLKEHLVFSETRAKLYIAEIAIGITALHDANIIYRDMKAENLMLDLAGHVRITDFGLTKEGVEGYADEGKPTLTFCGTPEYMAPEVITASHTKRGYGKAVDWWGVGTFLYEMLYGQPPFYDKQQDVMMRKITSGTLTFKDPQVIRVKDKEIPINPSSSAKKILKGFLERDPRKRLGCGGLDEIKKHQFFRDMDFRVVAAKGIRPDFVPPSKQDGVKNFEPCKDDDFDDSGTLATSEQNKVQDWSYMGAP
jgi:serine/threonine protein kinase